MQTRLFVLVVAALMAATASLVWHGAEGLAEAKQPEPAGDGAPPAGTATGGFRPGLTKAGLVSVESLGDAHVWLGLKSGEDRAAHFDVQVELLNNGAPVASGLQRCVGDLENSGWLARKVVVPWERFDPPTLEVGDVLSLRVATRIGTTSDDAPCAGPAEAAGLRLFHDATGRDSRFAATITPEPSVNLFLRGAACDTAAEQGLCQSHGVGCVALPETTEGELSLSDEKPRATQASCQDSEGVRFAGGNAWSGLGTWNLDPQCDCADELIPDVRDNPSAPEPEPVSVESLPLPPSAPTTTDGSCSADINCPTTSGSP